MSEKLTEPQKRALGLLDLPDGCVRFAIYIAEVMSWNPRATGAKLAALERRGLLERKVVHRGGGKYCVPVHGWRVTDRGREVLRDA